MVFLKTSLGKTSVLPRGSPEKDSRASAEGGLPVVWQWFAAVTANRQSTGGGGEGRGAGPWPLPPQLPAAAARQVLASPGRGGGGGGGGGERSDSDPRPRVQRGRLLRRLRRKGYGWGDHPCWAVPHGPPGGVLVGGACSKPGFSPGPWVTWLQPGPTVTRRRIPEEAAAPASVWVGQVRTQEADRAGGAIYQGVARGAGYQMH
jgi:hypothetical protein